MNFRKNIKQETLSFQLTPMIDVVFLLLCFFVTSQLFSQWESEIDITLPTAATGQAPQRHMGEIIVNILEDGNAIVNGKNFADEDLKVMLTRMADMYPGQPVLLRADKSTPYEHVINILDLCRQADIWNISFATSMPETPR